MDNNELFYKLKEEIASKSIDDLSPSDFLIPELEWIISLANLTEEDKLLFALRFIKRKKINDIMYEMNCGSNHTYYRHKKIVLDEFKRVLRRLFF